MDLLEGVGESSSPPRSLSSFGGYDIKNDVYNRLVDGGHGDALSNPDFREQLDAHFNRLPSSYGLDINMDKVEDVLLHQSLLELAKDPDNRPVFHIRFLENLWTKADEEDDDASVPSTSKHCHNRKTREDILLHNRSKDYKNEFEPCSKLEDLNLDVRKNSYDIERRSLTENFNRRFCSCTCIPFILRALCCFHPIFTFCCNQARFLLQQLEEPRHLMEGRFFSLNTA